MAAFVIYILKWAVTLTLLYSLYGLWLRRETFHTLNRMVLLAILLVSMLLPAFDLTTEHATPLNQGMEQLEMWVAEKEAPETEKTASNVSSSNVVSPHTPIVPAETPKTSSSSWVRLLTLLYGVVTFIFWGHYLYSLIRFGMLIRRAKRLNVAGIPKGVRVLMSREVTNSCSWIRWVVLAPSDTGAGQNIILTHELAHLQRGHSWDKLLCECTCRMLWFLPFAWMLRQDLADVHEFEADRSVLDTGIDIKTYNELIINKAVHAGLQPVANAFNESKTKKRMIMMFKKKSTKMAALKALYLLPLIAFSVTAFAKPRQMEDIKKAITQEPFGLTTEPEVVAVLDSTMQAVGARKIGEGVYIGAFRPNYTNDTIRVQSVYLDNEKAEHIAEHIFTKNRHQAYTITLQAEDRKELGRGYHIRWMYPVEGASTQAHVNKTSTN
ncbi:MAG: M56 family metallopeptidase [Bacteroidaceae bacterium]|nr:M56 family metallopeptidase [Bacteroidaceae bacterium]